MKPGFSQPKKTIPIKWASPTQAEAFVYGPYPQCASGGWGSGKTWDFCMKGIYLSTTYRRNRGVIARHIGSELRATTMATFFKVCPPDLYDRTRGGRRNDQHGYLKLRAPFDSEILFIHLDDPESEGIIRGLEINWFFIDQAEENAEQMEEIFDLLLGRLGRWDVAEVPAVEIQRFANDHDGAPWPFVHPESGKAVPPPYPMLACNPDTEMHWIYRRFHEESEEFHREYKKHGYKMFHMPSEENRFLGEANRKFLLAHDEAFVRRNVQGLWGSPEGSIHYVDKRCIIKGSPAVLDFIRQRCLLYRTMDHGDSAPTCVLWWGVDRNGNIFFYREYYMPNEIVSVHRQNVWELSEGERYEQDLADPAIFTKLPQRKGGRWSTADEWADVLEQDRRTAIFWQAADNNELGTRNRINEYLRVDPERINPWTGEPGSPRLFFVQISDEYPQGCYHSLRETKGQRRVKIGTSLGKPIYSDERNKDIADHGYDPVRYALASRSGRPQVVNETKDGTFNAARERLAAYNRRIMGIR